MRRGSFRAIVYVQNSMVSLPSCKETTKTDFLAGREASLSFTGCIAHAISIETRYESIPVVWSCNPCHNKRSTRSSLGMLQRRYVFDSMHDVDQQCARASGMLQRLHEKEEEEKEKQATEKKGRRHGGSHSIKTSCL